MYVFLPYFSCKTHRPPNLNVDGAKYNDLAFKVQNNTVHTVHKNAVKYTHKAHSDVSIARRDFYSAQK